MIAGELGGAFTLLTRLPVGALLPVEVADPTRSLWAYPVVGAVVGGLGAAAYTGCGGFGVPPLLGALWALVAGLLLTGALHEDGLADMADGFGGGRTRARKLEIMRDSRVGSYGVLALVLAMAIRWSALAAMASPGRVGPALIVSGGLSRGMLAVPMIIMAPARGDGLAAGLRHAGGARLLLGPLLAALLSLLLLPTADALGAIGLALATAVGISLLARQQIGGYTGDVLGACAVAIECMVLSLLAAA